MKTIFRIKGKKFYKVFANNCSCSECYFHNKEKDKCLFPKGIKKDSGCMIDYGHGEVLYFEYMEVKE